MYLDTHVAVWLYSGEIDRFTSEVSHMMESEDLILSPAAVLEMQYLSEAGKITVKPTQITEYLKSTLSCVVSAMRFDRVVVEAVGLVWTRDPFDRLITGEAKAADSKLVTKDTIIRENYDKAVW